MNERRKVFPLIKPTSSLVMLALLLFQAILHVGTRVQSLLMVVSIPQMRKEPVYSYRWDANSEVQVLPIVQYRPPYFLLIKKGCKPGKAFILNNWHNSEIISTWGSYISFPLLAYDFFSKTGQAKSNTGVLYSTSEVITRQTGKK